MEEKLSTMPMSLGNSNSPHLPLGSLVLSQVMNMDLERNLDNAATGEGATISTTATAVPGPSGGGVDSLGKKRRGRPRKYDADGNLRLPYKLVTTSPTDFSSSKRGRGRPPASSNCHLLASIVELFASTAGGDFTPHVVTVNTGEDVAGKILSFSQKGPRGICVLSANGAVSTVCIRQPGSSGGILTYEAWIFLPYDRGGGKSKTGGLSVSLAGPDGRVIGGGLAGSLVAASPIQVVVGSFMPNGYKVHKKKYQAEYTVGTAPSATATAARPISQVEPDGDLKFCTTPTSPFPKESNGEPNHTTMDKHTNVGSSHAVSWNALEPTSIHRPYPDINVSLPSE
ncbi:AT-hook motif nuclear-localized protein 1-like [Gossypium australe]|uniref:AT-hook motif nuclear-localized protein n=1 Tax=Gossypium australe TaxID=47621 RepID=A0A5B6UHF6_9ROSI|nr:AT-hook motif nuclear-localized protein 1-like [Gossypium australe]